MKYQDIKKTRQPKDWITDSIKTYICKEEAKPIADSEQEESGAEEKDIETTKNEDRLISLEISLEDYEEGFRKWTEMTTTSLLVRHLGQYKALVGVEEISDF